MKFGVVFDLNFFYHLDLYQINKTLLKLIFTVIFYSRSYYLGQLLGSNNLVHSLKNSLGESRTPLHTMNSSRKR